MSADSLDWTRLGRTVCRQLQEVQQELEIRFNVRSQLFCLTLVSNPHAQRRVLILLSVGKSIVLHTTVWAVENKREAGIFFWLSKAAENLLMSITVKNRRSCSAARKNIPIQSYHGMTRGGKGRISRTESDPKTLDECDRTGSIHALVGLCKPVTRGHSGEKSL